jgi:hypothetical protein
MGWWISDGFDARERAGDNVVLSRNVSYVSRELCNEVQVLSCPGEHLSRFYWKA